jgi:hypothetical protein
MCTSCFGTSNHKTCKSPPAAAETRATALSMHSCICVCRSIDVSTLHMLDSIKLRLELCCIVAAVTFADLAGVDKGADGVRKCSSGYVRGRSWHSSSGRGLKALKHKHRHGQEIQGKASP